MEPIFEETGGMYSGSHELLQDNLKPSPKRDLALKSGFLSLQERLTNWNKQQRYKTSDEQQQQHQPSANRQQHQHDQDHRGQFATLHEFFQSKSSLRKQLEQEERMRCQKRPRMPIMRLSKEDWNVRCWEERLRAYKGRAGQRGKLAENEGANRVQRPELQVEVFNGRIDEVAKKLEKTREGAPLDEELYKLERNRVRELPREHSWTDQLKRELSQGAHDSKVLKRKILERQEQSKQTTNQREGDKGCKRNSQRPVILSPLGRPIGRILDDDDDDDDSDGD